VGRFECHELELRVQLCPDALWSKIWLLATLASTCYSREGVAQMDLALVVLAQLTSLQIRWFEDSDSEDAAHEPPDFR